jgi:transcriptional regulator with XRE-family HTH domain
MDIGKHISALRKEHSWSQSDLANKTGISQVMVGKYERDDATPSIDVAKKIADVFEVSLDFLVGSTQMKIDKTILKRIQDIQQLPIEDKDHLFYLLDSILQNVKTKQAFAQ